MKSGQLVIWAKVLLVALVIFCLPKLVESKGGGGGGASGYHYSAGRTKSSGSRVYYGFYGGFGARYGYSRHRSSRNYGEKYFQCKNGEKVDENTMCDSVQDCKDKSDEKSPSPCQGECRPGEHVVYTCVLLGSLIGVCYFGSLSDKAEKAKKAAKLAAESTKAANEVQMPPQITQPSENPIPLAQLSPTLAQEVVITVPHGVQPGAQLTCAGPTGQQFMVVVPPNVLPGASLRVRVPSVQSPPTVNTELVQFKRTAATNFPDDTTASPPDANTAAGQLPVEELTYGSNTAGVTFMWMVLSAFITICFWIACGHQQRTQQIAYYITMIVLNSLACILILMLGCGQEDKDNKGACTLLVWIVMWLPLVAYISLLSVDGVDQTYGFTGDTTGASLVVKATSFNKIQYEPICSSGSSTSCQSQDKSYQTSRLDPKGGSTGSGWSLNSYQCGKCQDAVRTAYNTIPTSVDASYASIDNFSFKSGNQDYTPPSGSQGCGYLEVDLGMDKPIAMISLGNRKWGTAYFSISAKKQEALGYTSLITGPLKEGGASSGLLTDFPVSTEARFIRVTTHACYCKTHGTHGGVYCVGGLDFLEVYTGTWADVKQALP